MSAIITDEFRKASAQGMIDSIATASNKYFMGIGKSEKWLDSQDSQGVIDEDHVDFSGIPVPRSCVVDINEAYENIATISQTTSAYRLIPRIDWTSGTTYKVYDANDPECFFADTGTGYQPCYVMTADREIYLCLKNDGNTDSTVKPTIVGSNDDGFNSTNQGIINLSDNYMWAYICTVKNTSGFYTSQFIAISNAGGDHVNNAIKTSESTNSPYNRTGGLLYGFRVDKGGTGYGSGTTTLNVTVRKDDDTTELITFTQDSTDSQGADTFILTESGGAITGIEIDTVNLDSQSNRHQKIVAADVDVDHDGSATGAEIIPLIAPLEGFGGDNLKLLPSYYAGVVGQFEDTMGTDSQQDAFHIPFRQISLIKDTSIAEGTSAEGVRHLGYTGTVTGTTGKVYIFEGTESTPKAALEANDPVAYLDYHETGSKRLYYHQNNDPTVNYKEFTAGSTTIKISDDFTGSSVTNLGSIGTITVNAGEYNKVKDFTDTGSGGKRINGDIIFIENRAKVTRATGQTEEVRLVIQF